MKRKTYFIIGVVLAVIIIAAIAVTIAINSNKNVKDLYFQTEIKNFVDLMNEIQKNQNDTVAKYKPFKENPSRTRYEISAKLSKATDKGSVNSNSSNSFINLSEQAIDLLNNAKLIYNSRYDIGKDINMTTLSLLLAGQNIVDINTISGDGNIGLQIPVIYDKYFIMDKNNISGALENLGLNIPIKSIISPSNLKDAASFSTEDAKNLFTDYISFLQENVTDDNISMSKNVELQELQHPSIASENAHGAKKTGKYNIFNIKLSEDKFKSAALQTINILCSDSRFINMTAGNLTSVLNLIEESGLLDTTSSFKSVADEIKNYEDIEYLKVVLTDFINNSAFPEGFNMTLVVDLKGNIVDRKINFSSEASGEPIRKYAIQAGSFYTKAVIEQGSNENSSNNALIEYEEVRNKSQGNTYIRVNCVNNIWPDFDLTLNLGRESSKDDKRKALNTNYLIDINLTAVELGFNNANILIDVKREDRYDVEFTMPELNSETAINLSTSSKDEIEALMMDLQFSAAKFLLGNQSILDAFTSK